MSLQGLGLINIALNHWLKKYDFDCRVRGADTDFYWYHDDTISYTFFFEQASADNWELLMEELDCHYDLNMFYTAFLHEVGHSETYFSFGEEEIEACNELHRLICKDPYSFAEGPDYVYTHMPIEYEASRWAVNYINTYPDRIRELVNLVGKAVQLFYKINDVVTEDDFDGALA